MNYSEGQPPVWSDEELFEDYVQSSGSEGFEIESRMMELDAWRDTYDEIIGYLLLTDDWDGLGAIAPRPDLIQSAIELLEIVRGREWKPPSRVLPTSTGDLLFEWQTAGLYVEAEITQSRYSEWMVQEGDEQPIHWTAAWHNPDIEIPGEPSYEFSGHYLYPRDSVFTSEREAA